MLGGRWQQKPPQGTPLDPMHGLCQGLAGFYALPEVGGTIAHDLSGNGLGLGMTGFGSANPWSTGSPGLLCTTSAAGAVATLPASLQLGWPISFAIGFRQLGTPTFPTYFCVLQNDTSANPYFSWGFSCVSAAIDVKWNSAGTQESLATSYTPAIGVDTVLSSTLTSTSQNVYAQGSLIGSASTSYSNPTYTASAQVAIGIETGSTGRQCNALIYWCAWWTRMLSPGEHAVLAENVWQMFAPRPFYWLARAGASGKLIRVNWDGGYKQILEGGFAA